MILGSGFTTEEMISILLRENDFDSVGNDYDSAENDSGHRRRENDFDSTPGKMILILEKMIPTKIDYDSTPRTLILRGRRRK